MELNEFFESVNSNFGSALAERGGYITFSNTGKRGEVKHFCIGLDSVIQTLKDLHINFASFKSDYVEKEWRDAGSLYYKDPVANAFATVQTKPLFSLLSKVIIWSNDDNLKSLNPDQEISLDPALIANAIQKITDLAEQYYPKPPKPSPVSEIKGENIIYYGAPGTGKSYRANNKHPNIIRTVFHSETLTHDFIGSYKPYVTTGGNITYEFVPGAFINAIVKAAKNPAESVTLVIEEINRANAGAVFGEVFQLLDRDANGVSEYSIAVEKPLFDYLHNEIGLQENKLQIPGNLTIVATMNSADQGVYTLDSAFKRRWRFIYCPIDFTELPAAYDQEVTYGGSTYLWSDFAKRINQRLSEVRVNEDKLIGPFFLKSDEIRDSAKMASKLLIYLWDDVVRHDCKQMFDQKYTQFSSVQSDFIGGKEIFSFKMTDA